MPDDENNRRRPLRNRLIFRLGVGLCLGAAAIFVVVAVWNVRLQRDHLTDLVTGTAQRTAETIQRSLHDAMLRNGMDEIQGIIDSVTDQSDIEHIRIFDPEGRVQFSSAPSEVSLAGFRSGGLFRDSLEPRFRVRRFEMADGTRMLGVTAPIPNEQSCTACHVHAPDRKVLGVLDVQLSMEPVEAQLAASEGQLAIGLAVAVACVALVAGVLVWRMVVRPVRTLTAATVSVGHGDLSARVPITNRNELGVLAASWNDMVGELAKSRRELADWSHTLEERVEEKTRALQTAHDHMVVVEKMASLGKLAAVVAHEINNPLAGIGTYATLLRKRLAKGDVGEDADRVLAMVEDESKRCGRIVRNLLLFSRDQAACFAEVDLVETIERNIMLVKHRADLQEVEIVTALADELPTIMADRGQIQQLLLVLMMNAIEAMPEGGTLTISARAGDADDLVLSVADTGCGISEKERLHVFEPFYSTKEQGVGVGLGLAVAYGIVERHGGSISLASELDEGTTFTVHLPRKRAPQGEFTPAGEHRGVS